MQARIDEKTSAENAATEAEEQAAEILAAEQAKIPPWFWGTLTSPEEFADG